MASISRDENTVRMATGAVVKGDTIERGYHVRAVVQQTDRQKQALAEARARLQEQGFKRGDTVGMNYASIRNLTVKCTDMCWLVDHDPAYADWAMLFGMFTARSGEDAGAVALEDMVVRRADRGYAYDIHVFCQWLGRFLGPWGCGILRNEAHKSGYPHIHPALMVHPVKVMDLRRPGWRDGLGLNDSLNLPKVAVGLLKQICGAKWIEIMGRSRSGLLPGTMEFQDLQFVRSGRAMVVYLKKETTKTMQVLDLPGLRPWYTVNAKLLKSMQDKMADREVVVQGHSSDVVNFQRGLARISKSSPSGLMRLMFLGYKGFARSYVQSDKSDAIIRYGEWFDSEHGLALLSQIQDIRLACTRAFRDTQSFIGSNKLLAYEHRQLRERLVHDGGLFSDMDFLVEIHPRSGFWYPNPPKKCVDWCSSIRVYWFPLREILCVLYRSWWSEQVVVHEYFDADGEHKEYDMMEQSYPGDGAYQCRWIGFNPKLADPESDEYDEQFASMLSGLENRIGRGDHPVLDMSFSGKGLNVQGKPVQFSKDGWGRVVGFAVGGQSYPPREVLPSSGSSSRKSRSWRKQDGSYKELSDG